MPSILRILDANANRAREALRVMEDAARFLLNDGTLSASLKRLRHELSVTLLAVPGLEANRDIGEDVGTSIKTETEVTRGSVADVVIAAGKRLSEALRVIEEFAKTLDAAGSSAGIAGQVEKLRYAGYALEQKLVLEMGSGLARQWRLCLLLTETLCRHHSVFDVLKWALDGGADCVQVREKEADGRWLLNHVECVVEMCRGRASVIVNDRPDVAMLAGADGVHLGQTDLPCAEVRKLVGRQLMVGVSTSNLEQAKRAKVEGADYCGVGPMFVSSTKHKDFFAGPAYLRQFVEWDGLPHLAIGGVTAANIGELAAAGGRGVAVSGAICGAEKPGDVARAMVEALAGSD